MQFLEISPVKDKVLLKFLPAKCRLPANHFLLLNVSTFQIFKFLQIYLFFQRASIKLIRDWRRRSPTPGGRFSVLLRWQENFDRPWTAVFSQLPRSDHESPVYQDWEQEDREEAKKHRRIKFPLLKLGTTHGRSNQPRVRNSFWLIYTLFVSETKEAKLPCGQRAPDTSNHCPSERWSVTASLAVVLVLVEFVKVGRSKAKDRSDTAQTA